MIKKIDDSFVRFKILLKRDLLNLKKPYWIGLVFIILILFEFCTTLLSPVSQKKIQTVDTIVPAGYVLVPLSLINMDSIQTMIGEKTLVDIYSIGEDIDSNHNKHLIATHLPLIRSTIEPSQVAVLVEETDEKTIKSLTNPVFAVVKSPNSKREKPLKTTVSVKSLRIFNKIIYGDSI